MNANKQDSGGLLPRLVELFCLDEESGVVLWRSPPKSRPYLLAQPAGSVVSNGRIRVEFDGRTLGAHVIAFALHHGRLPAGQVDHINQDKKDNRPCNLREATNAENSRNRTNAKPPKSGRKGVSLHKGRYVARIMSNGAPINLGSFDTAEQAAEAYNEAAIKYHGEFACLS